MKRPKLITYAFGNPVSSLCIYGFTALVGYQLTQQHASGLFLFLTAMVALHSLQCSKEIAAYRQWKLEWDGMGGQVRKPFLVNRPRLRELVYFMTFLVSSFLTACVSGDYEIAFVIGRLTAMGIAIFIVRWGVQCWQAWQASRKQKPQKETPVAICLPVPDRSPNYREACSALPAYCQELLARSSSRANA